MNHRRLIYTLTPLLTLALLLVPQITFASGIGDAILEVLYIFVVSVFGMFVWFGAVLLNFGINQFVIGFGDVYNNSGIGVAVNNTWVIIRDFVNLGFIFGLVYIGLRMILDSNNANTRRWLANLIIAALLVNFSLFATKFVIDVSNKLATEIACAGLSYPQGKNTKPADKTGCGLNGGSDYRIDVGGALMARMGLTTIFSEPDDALPSDLSFGYIFGTAILFLVAAFVFASGGILLFIRFAVLNLYLVFSAAMFLSWVIPGIQDTMNSYWKGFLKRAFFAPIYLLMLYFSFKIIDGLQISIRGTGDGDTGTSFASPNWSKTLATASEANDPAGATLGTLPFFVLICIFMIASLVVAQKLGADGAGKAVSIGKNLGNKLTRSTANATKRVAGGATFGLAARGLQGTVGLGANQLSNNRRFQNLAANNKLARGALRATRGIADSSFDARKVGGLGKGLGIGEGIKGGYNTREKNKQERDKKFFESLKPVSEEEMKSRENQGRVEDLTDEKTLEAKTIIESETKATETLTTEITDLDSEIKSLTEALKLQVKNGTITSNERYEKEREITNKKTEQNAITKVRDAQILPAALEKQLKKLQDAEAAATDPRKKADLREQQEAINSQLFASRTNGKAITDSARAIYDPNLFENASDTADQAKDKKNKRQAAAIAVHSTSYNEVKFENQLTYLEGKKNKFQRKDGSFKFNPLEEASYDNLKEKYGASANELGKKSKENKESKKLAEQLAKLQKESGGDGGAPAPAAAPPPPATP